jgi:hypothetical protein
LSFFKNTRVLEDELAALRQKCQDLEYENALLNEIIEFSMEEKLMVVKEGTILENEQRMCENYPRMLSGSKMNFSNDKRLSASIRVKPK